MIEQRAKPVTVQPRSLRLDAVDRIVDSAINYRLGMVSDLAAALAFLLLGLHRFVGSQTAALGVVLFGFLCFGLLEYAVHRWVLHGRPAVARRGHAHHHATPQALISTPLFVILAGALMIWWLLGLVLPAGVAALLVFGLYAGYNHFVLLHHWQHHGRTHVPSLACWGRLKRFHDVHHQRPAVNFGISTTVWDHLFGTFQPAAPVTNHSLWRTMASSWIKRIRKPTTTS